MKKRLVGIITAFAMLAMPINSTCSAEEKSTPLKELAKQLGCETDYFTFVNKSTLVSDSKTDENYIKFLNSCSNAEITADPFDGYYHCLSSGRCMAISTLEVLSHNGIIKPSDIQSDSNFLTDITLDEEVETLLHSYQLLQLHTELELYMRWYLSHYSSKEKVKMLLDTAERCMKEGKYFLMVYDATNYSHTASGGYSHAVVGMGIADGNWTFNDEEYDKCILTVDSNAVNGQYLPQEWVALGFTEKCCLYVNTENNKLYCPGFDIGTDDGLTFFCTDDETLINYNGKLNPSETIDIDLSLLNKVKVDSEAEYSITAQRLDGTVYDVIESAYESNLSKNTSSYYCDGKSVVVENTGKAELSAYFNDITHSVDVTVDENAESITKYASEINISGIEKNASYSIDYILNEGNYDFTPHYRYKFSGVSDKSISVEVADNGIILRSENGISCTIETNDVIRDSDGKLVDAFANTMYDGVCSVGSIMVSFDENGKICYYTGENFDKKVVKGDVDCDGKITAYDASCILSAYATSSSGGEKSYIGNVLGDMDGDEKITAYDASLVLGFYVYNEENVVDINRYLEIIGISR